MMIRYLFLLLCIILISCSKEKKSNKAGMKMQEFVINISNYAKSINPYFTIVPQNGVELAFENMEPTEKGYANYLSAIDGLGIEELFYNSSLEVNNEILDMARQFRSYKKIMVADYVADSINIQNAINRSLHEEFICFPRTVNNYDYTDIPDSIINENADTITNLYAAKNYLYLISNNNFNTKAEMIAAIDSTNYDAVILDLFFNDEMFTNEEIIHLKNKANGGKRLILSYINIGAAEKYRYYWQDDWKIKRPNFLKKAYEGYEDEVWVKFWDKDWQEIIYGNDNSYIKKIIDAGFDGAYLDNVEAYYFLYFEN
jgi:cysteinyl-tRNA synthetase, unknown class